MLKFLIDECLSPELTGLAHRRGFEAAHVNWLKLDARRDQIIAVAALAGDYTLVTNNGVDFRPIYRALDLHPGLVVILPSVTRVDQIRLFALVLDRFETTKSDLVNKLVEVDRDGVVSISDCPPNHPNL